METSGREHLEGGGEHLLASLLTWQARGADAFGRAHGRTLLAGIWRQAGSRHSEERPYAADVTVASAFPREDIRLPGRTLSVRHAEGRAADLPTALLVHGLGGSSLNWTDLMDRLSGDIDSWAVDLGGFGYSPPPRDGKMSPSGHARGLVEFIAQLNRGPVHLFGNSMGGAVALQLAARRPDLVRSLTLISPALPSLFATKSNVHLPVIAVPGVGERLVPKYLQVDAGARVQATIDVCYADPSRASKERLAEAIEEVTARDHLPYATDAFLRSLRGLLGTYLDLGPNRPWKLAERVECPTLLIYGRKDPLVDPRTAFRATRHFKNAHVVVLPDSGHVAQMEHPEFVAAAWERFILTG